jgi:glycosyltransferase involved in cell wall biosynthesis
MSVAITEAAKLKRELQASVSARRRPRVLHLITSFEIGGTERQAVELLKRLDSDRYDVRLAALRNEGPFYQEIAARFPNVPEFPLSSFYNRNAVRQLLRLRKLMKSNQIDILHAHDFYAGLIGAAAARLAGVRVIACQRHLKLSDRRMHRWGQRIIQLLAHRILVNSEAIRDYIISKDGVPRRKIVVIKNGIGSAGVKSTPDSSVTPERREAHDALCAGLGLDPKSRLVGTIARLQPVKGHRYLIEAAARVLKREPAAHFIIVGGGPLRDELENQIAALGIEEHVHLLGDRSDVSRLTSSFDLMVLASLHEGLPNAVMEAMAAGVPVVATDAGGTKELIIDGETGYLVPPADVDALAERITFALTNEATGRLLAARGLEFIKERYSVERMVQSVENLYMELKKN